MKIEWNGVTWYSKSIALILFIALPFIGFYCGIKYGTIIAEINNTPSLSPLVATTSSLSLYYSTPSEWQTDANNTAGGFSIAYPIDFDTQDNYAATPSLDWRLNANGVSGVKYFTLTVRRAFAPQTNFADATLTVGASKNTAAVAQCLTADANTAPATATSSAMIDGVAFTIFHTTDAGAGNYYETTSYRAIHNGSCYAIEYTIHSNQIENYPASYALQPFNEQTIHSLMENIIQTITFL